jgi:hypothetical protein
MPDHQDRRTNREMREGRRDRRREWAEGRRSKADAAHQDSADAVAPIPMGQPILKGHHSQRRHERALERSRKTAIQAVEHSKMAEHHDARADNIDGQLETSIFDDDPDAIERLRDRIAQAEQSRDRIKSFNASCRRGQPDLTLLNDDERSDLRSIVQVGFAGPKGQFPSYKLSNLGGRIRGYRQRLERLEADTSN